MSSMRSCGRGERPVTIGSILGSPPCSRPTSSSWVTSTTSSRPRPGPASWPGAATGAWASSGCPAAAPISASRDLGIAEAVAAGARTMVVAVANSGGTLADHWAPTLVEALEAGLDLGSGLHQRLAGHAGGARGGRPLRSAAVRRPQPEPALCHRDGQTAAGQAAAHRRHRLQLRQEVHGPGDRAGTARQGRRGGLPRHRADRDHDRRRGGGDRRRGGGLHLGCRGVGWRRWPTGRTGT